MIVAQNPQRRFWLGTCCGAFPMGLRFSSPQGGGDQTAWGPTGGGTSARARATPVRRDRPVRVYSILLFLRQHQMKPIDAPFSLESMESNVDGLKRFRATIDENIPRSTGDRSQLNETCLIVLSNF